MTERDERTAREINTFLGGWIAGIDEPPRRVVDENVFVDGGMGVERSGVDRQRFVGLRFLKIFPVAINVCNPAGSPKTMA